LLPSKREINFFFLEEAKIKKMEGKLIIEKKVEVANVELAKAILEIISDFPDITVGEAVTKINEKESEEIDTRYITIIAGQLIYGGLIKESEGLTEEGRDWLRKKITELR
jgi:hypothetical protein